MLDSKAGLLHEPQKRLEVGWLLFQSRNDGKPYPLLGRERLFTDPLTVVQKTAFAMGLGIKDHRQVIFQTYPVREPPERKAGADEIMVLPGAIVSCGIVIDMVVYMILVNVGTNKELILTLRPAHSSFIADPIGLLRGYLSGLERLAYLEEQRPSMSASRPVSALYWLCTSRNSECAVVWSQRYEDTAPSFSGLRAYSNRSCMV